MDFLYLWESLPAVFMMYFLYLLMKHGCKCYAWIFAGLIVLFVLLKFQLLPFPDWSPVNRFLWWLYNILRILFALYLFTYFIRKHGNNTLHTGEN